jgi:hypothetical protein
MGSMVNGQDYVIGFSVSYTRFLLKVSHFELLELFYIFKMIRRIL